MHSTKAWRLYDLSLVFLIGILLLGAWLYAGPADDAAERRQALSRGVDNVLGGLGTGEVLVNYGGIDQDPEMNARIDSIFERVVVPAQEERSDLEYQVAVLKSDVPNAFALPGGRTYITRGLVELLDDDEIAGVLGHELVHTVKSHGTIAFGRDIGLIIASGYVVDQVAPEERERAAQLARVGHALVSTGYSRSAETEADTYGLRYAVQAGYHPLGLVRALEKIEKYQRSQRRPSDPQVPEYFRTHPMTEDRIRNLREEARRLGFDVYVPGDAVTEALRRLHGEGGDDAR